MRTVLPKIVGPLAKLMPKSLIQTVNKVIQATLLENPCVTETDAGNDSASDSKTKHATMPVILLLLCINR